jgi:hypothetical protein
MLDRRMSRLPACDLLNTTVRPSSPQGVGGRVSPIAVVSYEGLALR